MFIQELDELFDNNNLLPMLEDYYINPSLLISDTRAGVGIYDSESNQYFKCISLPKRSKILVALPNNNVIVQQDNTLQIWSLKMGKYILTLPDSHDVVAAVELKDGTIMYGNDYLRFYNPEKNRDSIKYMSLFIVEASNGVIFLSGKRLVGDRLIDGGTDYFDSTLIEIRPNQYTSHHGRLILDINSNILMDQGIPAKLEKLTMLNSKNYAGICEKSYICIGENVTFTYETFDIENQPFDIVGLGDDTEISVLVADVDVNILPVNLLPVNLESLDVIQRYYHSPGLILKMIKPYNLST